MKCIYFTKDESDLIDNDDATQRLKNTKLDARFLSFLEKDDSFLTPWSWNPNAFKNENGSTSTKEKEYLSFHPESYFNFQIIDEKIRNQNAQENYKQCSSSTRSCSEDSYPAQLNFVITKAPTYHPVSYYYRNRKCYRSKNHSDAIVKGPRFNLVITKAPTYLPVSYYYRNMKCNRSKKYSDAIGKGPRFIRV